jgi:hypothetical protein
MYTYGSLWTCCRLCEHAADVGGRLWTSWIEPWVRIPPPPFPLSIGLTPWFEISPGSFDSIGHLNRVRAELGVSRRAVHRGKNSSSLARQRYRTFKKVQVDSSS